MDKKAINKEVELLNDIEKCFTNGYYESSSYYQCCCSDPVLCNAIDEVEEQEYKILDK